MDRRDAITKQWFDSDTVTVEIAPELEGWLHADSLKRLSGAPKDSLVKVSYIENAIELRVQNSVLLAEDMVRLVVQSKAGYEFLLKNAAFVLSPRLRKLGIGTRSFAIEVTEATSLGLFSKITTSAIGSPESLNPEDSDNQYNGVYSWARLGFDAEIPKDVCSHCSGHLLSYTRVNELMADQRGRSIWAEHASSLEMEFLLAEDSSSWKLLRSYLDEKQIRILP
jgi:hypothetical protein